jgi:hypothetical protein
VSHAPSQRSVRYSIDLLSPVDIGLLRHAEVVHEAPGEHEAVIAEWVFAELPD